MLDEDVKTPNYALWGSVEQLIALVQFTITPLILLSDDHRNSGRG